MTSINSEFHSTYGVTVLDNDLFIFFVSDAFNSTAVINAATKAMTIATQMPVMPRLVPERI